MKTNFFWLLLTVLMYQNCQPANTQNRKSEPGGTLLLKSGFEEGVRISDDMNRIVGSDIREYAWDASVSWIEHSRFVYMVSKEKDTKLFMEPFIEKSTSPSGIQTNILGLANKADDPDNNGTSRCAFNFYGKEPPDDFKEGYIRYRMMLQENLNTLIPTDKETPFYMIMEWKEPKAKTSKSASECMECCGESGGGTNNYRINIGLQRNLELNEFFWVIRGERVQPCRKEEWRYESKQARVPLGEWFLVEAYLKKDTKDGRVYFAVNEQVVLDTDEAKPAGFTGRTQHPDNPMHLFYWAPMKNYHGMEWNKQGPVSQWYDDFELWSSFPADHPALKNRKNIN